MEVESKEKISKFTGTVIYTISLLKDTFFGSGN